MIRVYDTNALWRHDEILRIRYLEAEIADMQKDIERQKQYRLLPPWNALRERRGGWALLTN